MGNLVFQAPLGGSTTISGPDTTGSNTITVPNASGEFLISAGTLSASSSVATNSSGALITITNTGTGNNVLATSPTLVTPNLGTPSVLVGTNITGTAAGLTVGTATNATTATTSTNLAGGSTGSVPYQSGSGATTFLSAGTNGQVLTLAAGVPTWSTVSGTGDVVGPSSATNNAIAIYNGTTGKLIQNSGATISAGVITASGFSGNATSATNIAGGATGSLPYQSGTGATTFLAAGSNGQVLTLSGGVPTWAAVGGTGTVTNVSALTLGTSGTDLSSTVANSTTTPVITLNVPTASATNRGVLSAADWTTFNNKGNGTVTSVTGTAPVVSSGGTTPAISMAAASASANGYLTSTDWSTFNSKQPAGTYVTSVSATSPVTSSGGTTPTIAMPAATTSVSGYLTSTDWNTFNNKGSGSVTSVSGTGTVNGLTLTGTVTSSGSLTLGGTLDLSSPPAIGGTTAAAITGTTITANTKLVSSYLDASGSGGGALRTAGGSACLQWGGGGGVNLTLDGSFNMNPANSTISMAPSGSGTVTINPATAGTVDNMAVGGTTAAAGTFTVVKATEYIEKSTAIAASAIDLSASNYFTKTISGTTTFTISNAAASGLVNSFILQLTNGGSATVNWFSGVKWAGGTAPTLTASGYDDLGFFTIDGGTTWQGFVLGKAMA
jgi:hypothetical protein